LEAIHTFERITHTKVRLQKVGRRENEPIWRVCDAAAWDTHVHSRQQEVVV
jgi:hypothetical protein